MSYLLHTILVSIYLAAIVKVQCYTHFEVSAPPGSIDPRKLSYGQLAGGNFDNELPEVADTKKFIYLIQAKTFFVYDGLQGPESDYLVLTWGKPPPDGEENAVYFPNSTLNEGRNELLRLAISKSASGREGYLYYIMMDDDLILEESLLAKQDLETAEELFTGNPFRTFERWLLRWRPAMGVVRYHFHHFVPGTEANVGFNFDECVRAFHRDAVFPLLPYAEGQDFANWHYSGVMDTQLAHILYGPYKLQCNLVLARNPFHGGYPTCNLRGWTQAAEYIKGALQPSFAHLIEYRNPVKTLPQPWLVARKRDCSYYVSREQWERFFVPIHPYVQQRFEPSFAERFERISQAAPPFYDCFTPDLEEAFRKQQEEEAESLSHLLYYSLAKDFKIDEQSIVFQKLLEKSMKNNEYVSEMHRVTAQSDISESFLMGRGAASLDQGFVSDALVSFHMAVLRNPSNIDGLRFVAQSLQKLNHTYAAARIMENVCRRRVEQGDAVRETEVASAFAPAAQAINFGLRRDNLVCEDCGTAAALYSDAAMFDIAIELINRSIEMCPLDHRSRILRAEAFKGMCKVQRRVDDLIEGLLLSPLNLKLYEEFAITVKTAAQYRFLLLKTLMAGHKGNDRVHHINEITARADKLRRLKLNATRDGEWTSALEQELSDLLSKAPPSPEQSYDDAMLFATRALASAETPQMKKAAGALIAALYERKGPEALNQTIAYLQAAVGASDEQIPEFHETVLYTTLGHLLRRQDRYEEALVAFEKANEVVESHPYHYVSDRFTLLRRLGRTKEADDLARSAVKYFAGVASSGDLEHLKTLALAYHMSNFDNENSVRAGRELKRRMGRTTAPTSTL